MHNTDKIEQLLRQTAMLSLTGGIHRESLKQELLAQMRTEEHMMNVNSPKYGNNVSLPLQPAVDWRIVRPRWLAVAATLIVATTLAVNLNSHQDVVGPPTSENQLFFNNQSTVERLHERLEPLALGRFQKRTTRARRTLEECVADAQVIVVATALDSAPAVPNVPGDLPENLIRFKVRRVLKGVLADEEIVTRTPTAANEFIGHDWIVMLSPEYIAGQHQFAGCYGISYEPEVKQVLSKSK